MRTLLVLARVSNLPTVWSNCLAAWYLAGGVGWGRFALVCLGASFLYTGGMFLNDAVDQDFDRRYRPERPIVSGAIGSRLVWALSLAWLGVGWVMFVFLGERAAMIAGLLVATIVLYDWVHKRTVLAPVLMAACRFLLYLLAAESAANFINASLLWRAAALFCYIIGLSYLARGESTGARFWRSTIALLFVPTLIAHLFPVTVPRVTLEAVNAIQVGWTLWSLCKSKPPLLFVVPQGVAGLLAGIALVDWLAVAGYGLAGAFLVLFALALLLQRIAPAT
jgi:4-hydroxybenzoate polyprenyltransferase